MPAAVKIKNPSVEIASLPFPLKGALKGGQAVVVAMSFANLLAAAPSIVAAFLVEDLGASYAGPVNTDFNPVDGTTGDLDVPGDLTVEGAAAVTGDIATNGTLEVAGTTSLADHLDVDGDVAVTGALGLAGNAPVQMTFAAAASGGSTVDAEARALLNAIRTFLITRGDMAAS